MRRTSSTSQTRVMKAGQVSSLIQSQLPRSKLPPFILPALPNLREFEKILPMKIRVTVRQAEWRRMKERAKYLRDLRSHPAFKRPDYSIRSLMEPHLGPEARKRCYFSKDGFTMLIVIK